MAVSDTSHEAITRTNLHQEVGQFSKENKLRTPLVLSDNQPVGCTQLAINPTDHKRAKHITFAITSFIMRSQKNQISRAKGDWTKYDDKNKYETI